MAEPLSIAASIMGIAGVAAQALKLCYSIYHYGKGVKSATKEIEGIMRELETLEPLYFKLRNLAKENPQMEAVKMLMGKQGALEQFQGSLEDLVKALEKHPGAKGRQRSLGKSLLWPLREADVLKHLDQISRIKEAFNFALSLDTASSSEKVLEVSESIDACVQILLQQTWGHAQSHDIALKGIAKSLEANKADVQREEVLKWLFPDPFDIKHVATSKERVGDTGTWLLNEPAFEAWSNSTASSKLLLGLGTAGAGKTYLSSLVIDHFRKQDITPKNGIAYTYFTYSDNPEQHSSAQILTSILKQLITISSLPLPQIIIELYDLMCPQKTSPVEDQLYPALLEIVVTFPRVFIVFDALDECHGEARSGVFGLLRRMSSNGIYVFATSRPRLEIHRFLPGAVEISLSARKQDILTYLQGKIASIESPAQAKLLQTYQKEVIDGIVDCAADMFLLARFYFKFVCGQHNAKKLKIALITLRGSPDGTEALDLCYQRVIDSIKANQYTEELAFSVLSWMVKAKRPLRVKELQQALAVEHGCYELDKHNITDEIILVEVCAGLVEIEERSGTLVFTHATIQEYLEDPSKSIFHKSAEIDIATACITYLSFDAIAQGPCTSPESLLDRLESYPFLEYASKYLSDHLLALKRPQDLPTEIFIRFLEKKNALDSYLQALNLHQPAEYFWDNYPKGSRSLHVASMIGFAAAVRTLIDQGDSLSDTNSEGQQPLHLAATNAHSEVVKLLLGGGADPSALDKYRRTPLLVAAGRGHADVVQLLLLGGANPSSDNSHEWTPLHAAAEKGHVAVVQLLLEGYSHPSCTGTAGRTPLHLAAGRGHARVVQLLLGAGLDPSCKSDDGQTPLQLAAGKGHEEVVQLLRSAEAELSHIGKSPLHLAADPELDDMVRSVVRSLRRAKSDLSNVGHDDSGPSRNGKGKADCPSPAEWSRFRSSITKAAASVRPNVDKGQIANLQPFASTSRPEAPRISQLTPLPVYDGHSTSVQSVFSDSTTSQGTQRSRETPVPAYEGRRSPIQPHFIHIANSQNIRRVPGTPAPRYEERESRLERSFESGLNHRILLEPQQTPLPVYEGRTNPAVYLGENTDLRSAAEFQSVPVPVLNGRRGEYHSTSSGTPYQRPEQYRIIPSPLYEEGLRVIRPLYEENPRLIQPRYESIERAHPLYGGIVQHTSREMPQEVTNQGAVSPTTVQTLLHIAVYEGNTRAVQSLLSQGANPRCADHLGRTLLHVAAYHGHAAVAGLLLNQGADSSSIDDTGRTPLHVAVNCGHAEVVRLLLSQGANPLCTDFTRQTPLHTAAHNGFAEIASILLDSGADLSAQDPYGRTPLDLAERWAIEEPDRFGEVIRLLRNHWAPRSELPAYNSPRIEPQELGTYT